MTPTKGNLIKAKKTLDFSKKGYNLLDKKRTVLIKEMMGLIDLKKFPIRLVTKKNST